MHSLLSESGKEITESKEIRKEAVAFYEELYKGEQVVEEEEQPVAFMRVYLRFLKE